MSFLVRAYVVRSGHVECYVGVHSAGDCVPLGERTFRTVAELQEWAQRLADTAGHSVEYYVRLHDGSVVDWGTVFPAYQVRA